jgi:signal peptidase I
LLTLNVLHGIERSGAEGKGRSLPDDKDLDSTKVRPVTNKRAWTISIAASILLLAGVFIALFGAGFHLYIVKTPSMGTIAPVGTLVAVHAQDSYAIGDVVSYARNGLVYTHRIVDVTAQGFITKGDINGAPDALPVNQSEIVGTVAFYGKYLGFLVEALPWLLIGGAIVYGLSLMPRIGRPWRWHFRLVGWSLVTSLVALWSRPWVNMVMTGYVAQNDGVDMHLVNTGIFPVSVLGKVLTSGQDAVVTQTVADASGHYIVTPQLALNSWYFLLLLVICLTPVLASLLIGVEQEVPAVVAEPAVTIRRFRPQYRRIAPIALTVTASIFAVALVLQMSTNAAFAASIKNSTNTAGTRTWFTCQNAETGTTGAQFVWGLTAIGQQTDLTNNYNSGRIRTDGAAATASVSSPCPRDTQGSLMFNGGTCLFTNANATSTDTYSEEVWFQTTNSPLSGKLMGKLMGFASNSTPTTGNQKDYDHHIYIDPTGRVLFGVESAAGAQTLVSSPAGTNYADGAWHHVVATSASGTISLYLDDAPAVTRSGVAVQHLYKGDWLVGCGLLTGWPDAMGTAQAFPSYYTGNLRLAAVYDVTLSATQVREHYLAGTA